MAGTGRSEAMSRFNFDFTRKEYEYICKEAMFNPIDQKILEGKIMDLTYIQIGEQVGMSPDNVKKHVAKITKKILKII